ncbi:tetratricopeptide repeat protein [Winogradskyella maritima]|uniref:Tetratricopeptide repeat protein n=1 Tax=Winogradskyella maritima TaxID=1517766 RepID=A0ABV8AMR6_9FLAO|nr:tetratricopeptide repeat protein [Winogradskyella maritima]
MHGNPNLERGEQLYSMGRFSDAIPFLKDAMVVEEDRFDAQYLLAYSYFQVDHISEAEKIGHELRKQQPNHSGILSLLANIELNKNNSDQALKLIDEAISITPYEDDYFGIKSYVYIQKKDFKTALKFANDGLSIYAKSLICLNARATALTKLGKKEEAALTIESILQDNPENSYSHANTGWSFLEANNIPKALEHFKEALKIDPNDDYTRDGMLTAIKAKNKIYNLYLRYAFWIGNKSDKYQWGFIIGIYVIYRFALKAISASGLSVLAVPLIIIYLLFALGSWLMEPLSNMLLLMDSYGKYLLDRNSKLSGQILLTLLVVSLASYGINFVVDSDLPILLSIGCLASILPLTRASLSSHNQSRILGFSYGGLILLISILGQPLGYSFGSVTLALVVLFVAFTWLGNFIIKY